MIFLGVRGVKEVNARRARLGVRDITISYTVVGANVFNSFNSSNFSNFSNFLIVNCQLSIVNYQLSIVNFPLFAQYLSHCTLMS